MPYSIKPFFISEEETEKIRKEEAAMFEKAAILALGAETYRKRSFKYCFGEKEKDMV